MSHICTSKTFYAGGVELELKCWACEEKSIHKLSYVAMKCTACGIEYDPFEVSRGSLAMKIRHEMGLTRAELSKVINYSKHTIKKYEWGNCTKFYYKKLQKIFKKFIN